MSNDPCFHPRSLEKLRTKEEMANPPRRRAQPLRGGLARGHQRNARVTAYNTASGGIPATSKADVQTPTLTLIQSVKKNGTRSSRGYRNLEGT